MKRPTLRTYRRCVQIAVALAFILIPWLNSQRISFAYGNFLSFRLAGFPLADPLAVLQITLKNNYLALDLIIGAAVALWLAAALGTVFCSWVCPFGLLSEWAQGLGKRLLPKGYQGLHAGGLWIKGTIFILGLTGFLLFSTTPVLNQLSLPAWYSRIFQFIFVQGHLSLAIVAILLLLLIEMLSRRRLWCRDLCPQSVLLVLAKQLNPRRLQVAFDPAKCICKGHDHPCARACSLDLDPGRTTQLVGTDCNNCGNCVVACKKRGRALTFQFAPGPSAGPAACDLDQVSAPAKGTEPAP